MALEGRLVVGLFDVLLRRQPSDVPDPQDLRIVNVKKAASKISPFPQDSSP